MPLTRPRIVSATLEAGSIVLRAEGGAEGRCPVATEAHASALRFAEALTGTPATACRAFGLDCDDAADWSVAVDRVAMRLCAPSPLRKAA